MTDAELQQARALVEAATEGEWTAANRQMHLGPINEEIAVWRVASTDGDIAQPYSPNKVANAAFIAASRTLVPALLAEVERLTDHLRVSLEQNDALGDVNEKLAAKDVEVERLRNRQQELLATIVRVTNETPFSDEAKDALEQRGKLIAEIGTLRTQLATVTRERDEAVRYHESNAAEYGKLVDRLRDDLLAWRNWSDEIAPPFGSSRDRSDAGQMAAIRAALGEKEGM